MPEEAMISISQSLKSSRDVKSECKSLPSAIFTYVLIDKYHIPGTPWVTTLDKKSVTTKDAGRTHTEQVGEVFTFHTIDYLKHVIQPIQQPPTASSAQQPPKSTNTTTISRFNYTMTTSDLEQVSDETSPLLGGQQQQQQQQQQNGTANGNINHVHDSNESGVVQSTALLEETSTKKLFAIMGAIWTGVYFAALGMLQS